MKIGIIGAGQVGATAAYSMMMRRVGSQIMLVDRNADLAVAQARDILDATPFRRSGPGPRGGDGRSRRRARGRDRGRGQPEAGGEQAGPALAQRRDLRGDRAGGVGRDAGSDLSGGEQSSRCHDPDRRGNCRPGRGPVRTCYRVRHDPRLCAVPDAARGASRRQPDFYRRQSAGRHGDSEVLHWSGAAAGNLSVAEVGRQMGRELTDADRSRIDGAVRHAAHAIIKGKGATWFGVGPALPHGPGYPG